MMTLGKKVIIIEESDTTDGFLNGMGSGSSDSMLDTGTSIRMPTDLVIDKAAYTVYASGNKIAFPKKEFELLLLLASNPRKVFKRTEILQQLWGKDFRQKDSRSLDVHIRKIRKKLDDLFITTIRGVGYKLEK
jgi:two-component system alkaline phosphatase synthesis response regulator PhoP